MDFQRTIKWVLDIEQLPLKIVDRYNFAVRVNNPVFADSGIFVIVQLADVVIRNIVF